MGAGSVLTILTGPSEFFSSLLERDALRRGIVVFSFACMTAALTSLFYYSTKVRFLLALGPLSSMQLEILRPDYVAMSRLAYLLLAAVILMGISRLGYRMVRGRQVGTRSFVSAILHSFFVIFVVSLASLPLLLAYPTQEYGVVGASFEDVYLFNVTMTGRTEPSKLPVELHQQVISAKKLEIRYLDQAGQPVPWGSLAPEEAETRLGDSALSIMLEEAVIPGVNDGLPVTVSVDQIGFDRIVFRQSGGIERVLLNRGEIMRNPANLVLESVGALVSPLAWLWLVVVNAVAFRTLYGSSRKAAAGFGAAVLAVLVLLGIS